VENWHKNTYVGCTITEYPKISVRACLPQHKNKPHSELRPASIKKKRTSRKRATRQKWGWWCSVRQDQLPYQAKNSIDQCTCMQGMYWGLCRTHTAFFVLKTSQIEYSVMDCTQRYVKWNCLWMCHKTHSQLTLLFYTTISGDMRHSCFLYSKTSMSCGQIRTQPRLDEENTPRMGQTRSSVVGPMRGWDDSTNSSRS